MKCIIEVGLSIGDDICVHVQNTGVDWVYGFEPVPHLAAHSRQRCTNAQTNWEIIQKAVDVEEGTSLFYPGTTDFTDPVHGGGWKNGSGSLLKMSENISVTWPNRPDLVQVEPIEVERVRLDNFVREKNITEISFLEIDAQGKDLDVLKSLSTYISIVKSGKIEVPTSPDTALYQNQHSREETLQFLSDSGFTWEKENVVLQNEENYIFKQKL